MPHRRRIAGAHRRVVGKARAVIAQVTAASLRERQDPVVEVWVGQRVQWAVRRDELRVLVQRPGRPG